MNNSEKIAKLEKALKSPTTPNNLKQQLQAEIDKLKEEQLEKSLDVNVEKSSAKNRKSEKPKVGDFVKVWTSVDWHYGKITDDFSDWKQYVGDQNGYKITGIGDPLKPEQFEVISEEEYVKATSEKKTKSKKTKPSPSKKYYTNKEIKTVTVIEDGKKVVYKGDDVLNGAQFLAKGGKLEKTATYYPVRAIVEVELTDGSKVKPANGYHIKNGSTTIMEKGGETDDNLKIKQLKIIQKHNPAPNEYNTWIRKKEDIKTAKEAFKSAFEDGEMYPDFTVKNMEDALQNNKLIVYSSKPISQGVFVTPSKMNAQEYAGGKKGKVYEKEVYLEDIAWIDESEGQFASTNNFEKGGETETNEDFDFISFLDDMQPNVAKVLKEKGVEIDKFYKVVQNDLKLIPTILYSKLEENPNTLVIGYYDKNDILYGEIGTIEFELPEKEFHIRFPGLNINEVEMYAKGGWTKDHKYVNKAEDYEVRYAKGKNRKGYAEKGLKTATFDYKNSYSPLNITNSNNVKDFFKYLVNVEKVNFHPDDDFDDYINFETKKKTFTKKQAENLNRYMEDCFIVMDLPKNKDKEIYDVAIEVFNENKAFGGDVELPAGSFEQYMIYREKGGKVPIGRLAKGKTLEDIASMHNVSVYEIEKQMEIGEKIEMEHTTDVNVARAIAKDHIFENPNYYSLLKQIEEKPTKPSTKNSKTTRKNAPGAGSPIFALAKKIRTPEMSWKEAREEAKKQLSKQK
jgi:hypothetical protein